VDFGTNCVYDADDFVAHCHRGLDGEAAVEGIWKTDYGFSTRDEKLERVL
jgi:hypothetical protein